MDQTKDKILEKIKKLLLLLILNIKKNYINNFFLYIRMSSI